MNPIFSEYIEFLNNTSKTKVYDMEEGYLWLDKQIVKGFDKDGNIHMKVHGRNVEKFYCKKCFKKLHGLSEDDWDNRLKMFKQSNCNLF